MKTYVLVSLLVLALFLSVDLLRDQGGPASGREETPVAESGSSSGKDLDPVFRGNVQQVGSKKLIQWVFKEALMAKAVEEREGVLALVSRNPPVRFSGVRRGMLFLNEGGSWESLAVADTGFPIKREPRTVGVWIKTTSAAQPAVFNYGTEAPRQRFSLMVSQAGTFMFANVGDDFQGKTPVGDGEWHFLVATYDGKQVALYVDGNLDASRDTLLSTTLSGSADVGSIRGESSFFSGLINSVFIADFVLPSAEIQAMAGKRPAD